MNCDNVKVIKKISAGMVGTTYMCSYKKDYYVLKILHIFENERHKDYNVEIWRELELYKYVNKMSKTDQLFFTKLYDYKIYDNCSHIQIRPFKFNPDSEFEKTNKLLDESKWCIKYLMDYKGQHTLGNFLIEYPDKLKVIQIYSLLLQIAKIVLLLKEGGYAHGDLHACNLMITKTDKKYFNINDKKINHYGYQLIAIDYGNNLHKKYKFKWYLDDIEKYSKLFTFLDIFHCVMYVIPSFDYSLKICKDKNIPSPFKNRVLYNNGFYLLFNNHIDFCKEKIQKYIDIFPEGKPAIDEYFKYYKTKKINEIIKPYFVYFYEIINRLKYEFDLNYPKLHKKYFGWCCETKWILPKKDCLEILLINNTKDMINFLLKKIDI